MARRYKKRKLGKRKRFGRKKKRYETPSRRITKRAPWEYLRPPHKARDPIRHRAPLRDIKPHAHGDWGTDPFDLRHWIATGITAADRRDLLARYDYYLQGKERYADDDPNKLPFEKWFWDPPHGPDYIYDYKWNTVAGMKPAAIPLMDLKTPESRSRKDPK